MTFSEPEIQAISGGLAAEDSGYTFRPSLNILTAASGLPSTRKPCRMSQFT